jgi:hypothetical protein
MEALIELVCVIGLAAGAFVFRQIFGGVLRNTPGLGRALSCLGCLVVLGLVVIAVLAAISYN